MVKCPECGAEVDIGNIENEAKHWQKLKKYQAENKKENRKKNPSYCQVKKKKAEFTTKAGRVN